MAAAQQPSSSSSKVIFGKRSFLLFFPFPSFCSIISPSTVARQLRRSSKLQLLQHGVESNRPTKSFRKIVSGFPKRHGGCVYPSTRLRFSSSIPNVCDKVGAKSSLEFRQVVCIVKYSTVFLTNLCLNTRPFCGFLRILC